MICLLGLKTTKDILKNICCRTMAVLVDSRGKPQYDIYVKGSPEVPELGDCKQLPHCLIFTVSNLARIFRCQILRSDITDTTQYFLCCCKNWNTNSGLRLITATANIGPFSHRTMLTFEEKGKA
jgi:hypothetical protein